MIFDRQTGLKSLKEVEDLGGAEREIYFLKLREYCKDYVKHGPFNSFTREIVYLVGRILRTYSLEIRGAEHIPNDEPVIFVCNHSNSHDFFTLTEVFTRLKIKVNPLTAIDGLNWASRLIFRWGNATFIQRDDNESKKAGEFILCNSLLNGISTIIFAESTWNLHPTKAMLPIKAGPIEIAMITGKIIIPTTFEYIEIAGKCKKESQLYSKCIVSFGKPIFINTGESIFVQADSIQKQLEAMRHNIWNEFGIKKKNLNDADIEVYMNHLDIKKNKAVGFKYISENESKFVRKMNGQHENEFYIDEAGKFVPKRY